MRDQSLGTQLRLLRYRAVEEPPLGENTLDVVQDYTDNMLNKLFDEYEKSLKRLESQVGSLKEKERELAQYIMQLRSEWEQAKVELLARIAAEKDNYATLEAKLAAMTQFKEQAEEQLAAADARLKAAKADLTEQNETITRLTRERDAALANVSELNETVSRLKRELETTTTSLSALKESYKDLEQGINEQMDRKNAELAELKEQMRVASQKVRGAKRRTDNLGDTVESHITGIDDIMSDRGVTRLPGGGGVAGPSGAGVAAARALGGGTSTEEPTAGGPNSPGDDRDVAFRAAQTEEVRKLYEELKKKLPYRI